MFPILCCGDRKRVRIVLAVLIFSVFASLSSAQTDNWVGTSGEIVLYTFDGIHGSYPTTLIEDAAGDLYGVTLFGGNSACNGGCGVIFKLSNSTGHWIETVIHSFTGGTTDMHHGPSSSTHKEIYSESPAPGVPVASASPLKCPLFPSVAGDSKLFTPFPHSVPMVLLLST